MKTGKIFHACFRTWRTKLLYFVRVWSNHCRSYGPNPAAAPRVDCKDPSLQGGGRDVAPAEFAKRIARESTESAFRRTRWVTGGDGWARHMALVINRSLCGKGRWWRWGKWIVQIGGFDGASWRPVALSAPASSPTPQPPSFAPFSSLHASANKTRVEAR